jgi:hypothetical protein
MASTTNGRRTPEQVTREIEQERRQLATAVASLRGELNAKTLLRTQGPKLAFAVAAIVGFKVAKALVRQHWRTTAAEHALGHERFSFGRFTILERDE